MKTPDESGQRRYSIPYVMALCDPPMPCASLSASCFAVFLTWVGIYSSIDVFLRHFRLLEPTPSPFSVSSLQPLGGLSRIIPPPVLSVLPPPFPPLGSHPPYDVACSLGHQVSRLMLSDTRRRHPLSHTFLLSISYTSAFTNYSW